MAFLCKLRKIKIQWTGFTLVCALTIRSKKQISCKQQGYCSIFQREEQCKNYSFFGFRCWLDTCIYTWIKHKHALFNRRYSTIFYWAAYMLMANWTKAELQSLIKTTAIYSKTYFPFFIYTLSGARVSPVSQRNLSCFSICFSFSQENHRVQRRSFAPALEKWVFPWEKTKRSINHIYTLVVSIYVCSGETR